jgi:tRNA-specific 2-thiouridylase
LEGTRLGTHRGIAFYTIGQREGLGIATGRPLYVARLDTESNTVFVGSQSDLLKKEFSIDNLSWVGGAPPAKSFDARVQIRSHHAAAAAHVNIQRNAQVKFEIPQRAVTPGQAAVFYKGDEVLGGGVIQRAQTTSPSHRSGAETEHSAGFKKSIDKERAVV